MTENAEIKTLRRQLQVRRRRAKELRSEYKRYKKQGRDIAGPYKILAERALWDVRSLEKSLASSITVQDIQKKMDTLTLRIAEIDAELRKRQQD